MRKPNATMNGPKLPDVLKSTIMAAKGEDKPEISHGNAKKKIASKNRKLIRKQKRMMKKQKKHAIHGTKRKREIDVLSLTNVEKHMSGNLGDLKPTASQSKESHMEPKRKKLTKKLPIKVDQGILAEEKEIKRLERMLGVNVDGKAGDKARKKLNKNLVKDGWGEDISDYFTHLDSICPSDLENPHNDEFDTVSDDCEMEDNRGNDRKCFESKIKLDQTTRNALEQEDAEIERLEKHLGIRGGNKEKALKKLSKEFAKDGFGDDFAEFLLNVDRSASDDDDVDDYDSGTNNYNNMDMDNIYNNDDVRLDSSDSESSSEESKAKPIIRAADRLAKGEDIYGRSIDKEVDSGVVAKYVPPHLRNNNALKQNSISNNNENTKSKNMMILKRKVNGILNRVSEESISLSVKDLSNLFLSNSHRDTSEIVTKCIFDGILNDFRVMDSLCRLFGAVISGLHLLVGQTFGAHFLEYSAKIFQVEYNLLTSNNNNNNNNNKNYNNDNATGSLGKGAHGGISKKCSNTVLVLSHLYNNGVIHSEVIYTLMQNLIKTCTEFDIELLMIILKNSGYQLRSDDAATLKDTIVAIQTSVARIRKTFDQDTSQQSQDTEEDNGNKAQQQQLNGRLTFMLETIYQIKNNRRSSKKEAELDRAKELRKWVRGLRSQSNMQQHDSSTCSSSDVGLRIDWNQLLDSDKIGRWWVVGAPWQQQKAREKLQQRNTNTLDSHSRDSNNPAMKAAIDAVDQDVTMDSKVHLKLLKLAKKFHMNTDIRRNIFNVLMTAADYMNAFERLLRLNLSSKQSREIVRVIFECSGREKTFNPYYSLLSKELCSFSPAFKFTFRLAFWDFVKQLDSHSVRKRVNTAKLLAHLVGKFSLSLNILKVVDFTSLDVTMEKFLSIFFVSLFAESDETNIRNCFNRIAHGGVVLSDGTKSNSNPDTKEENLGVTNECAPRTSGSSYGDNSGVQTGVLVFLTKTLKRTIKSVPELVMKYRIAKKSLETIAKHDSVF